MTRTILAVLTLSALILTPVSAETGTSTTETATAEKHFSRIPIGINAGVFLPTSGKVSSRFGSAWASAGIGIGSIRKASAQGGLAFDFSVEYQKKNDNHAFFAPVGIAYVHPFNTSDVTEKRAEVPYYGVSVDLVPVDLRSAPDNVHSGFHFTGGGSVFVGSSIGGNGYLEARYLGIGSVESFNLSGLSLNAGIRF